MRRLRVALWRRNPRLLHFSAKNRRNRRRCQFFIACARLILVLLCGAVHNEKHWTYRMKLLFSTTEADCGVIVAIAGFKASSGICVARWWSAADVLVVVEGVLS